jgi:hypothetical protein
MSAIEPCRSLDMRRGAPLLVVLLACFSCGGDDRSDVGGAVGTGRRDGGLRDAAPPAPEPEPEPDAGSRDHEIFDGARYLCGYDDADVLTLPGNADHPEIAMAENARGFALVHQDEHGGVFISAVARRGAARAPVRILSSAEAAQGVMLAGSAEGFLLAWRGEASGAALRTRELTEVEHGVFELSGNVAADEDGGRRSAVLGEPDGFVAAWIEADGGEASLRVQRLGADGMVQGAPQVIEDVAARNPIDLHLARLSGGGVLLAWLERDADGAGRVMGMPLSSALAPAGEAVELSRSVVSAGRFDLASRAASLGLIYAGLDGGVREALKYRRIDPDGIAREALFNVEGPPARVRHGSIAPFGQGFAVAYRALPSLGVPRPVIRVAFLNEFGEIVYEAELAETTEAGGRTTVAATPDGYVLVGWSSAWPSGAVTHAVKLHCPGALELCGGQLD